MLEMLFEALLKSQSCEYTLVAIPYNGSEYHYVDLQAQGTDLSLLVDTGDPTFFVSSSAFNSLTMSGDEIIYPDHNKNLHTQSNFIKLKSLKLEQSPNICSITATKGGVIDHKGVASFELDGVINPNQFAWGGCIKYDLTEKKIKKYFHARSDQCPAVEHGLPTITTGYKYIYELQNEAGFSKLLKLDTGLGMTHFHVSFFEGSEIILDETSDTVTDHNGIHPLYRLVGSVDIRLGDKSYTFERPYVTKKEMARGVNATIGMDVLRDAKIIVGTTQKPTIYLD